MEQTFYINVLYMIYMHAITDVLYTLYVSIAVQTTLPCVPSP